MNPHLFPALVMMLGWGLRGFIGGGPFGAMIAGSLVVLAICLRHPRREVAVLAAFGAIGVGFGGEMTYGQTVGFIVKAETFWWGLAGLTVKGAVWGALAGAVLGLGLRPRPRDVAWGVAVMIAATALGWKLINEPKLIYFSHPTDRPRPEIWAGFALAALALTLLLPKPLRLLPLAGLVGGGIGFGAGGAIQGLGRIFTPELKLHWWKYMEFTFGWCFGYALSWAFERVPRDGDDAPAGARPSPAVEWPSALAVTVALFCVSWELPLRYAYLVAGGAALVLVAQWRWLAPHLAYSVTFAAVCLDSARYWSREYKHGSAEPAYALAVAAALGFAWTIWRWRDRPLRDTFHLLMWALVADATFKFAMHPTGLIALADHIAVAFVVMAALASRMAARVRTYSASPVG